MSQKAAILVVGAGDATGGAIARRFAREGLIACVVRRNGEKLAPLVAEIEAQLHRMPGVADCAVFGVPDAEFGQSLVAAVQTHGEAVLTAQQVRDFLSSKLANFKVPRVIEFRDDLPREDTGKIFKRKLVDEYVTRR